MAGLTASEMMYEAKILYESIASADAPGFTPREWSVLLTQAQEKVVNGLCQQLDKDEFTRKQLANLLNYGHISSGITSAVNLTGYANSCIVPLTSLNETVQGFVYKPLFFYEQRGHTAILTNIKIQEVPQDYVWANLENPYKRPGKITFWQLPYKDDSVIVITDSGSLTHYYTAYIKKPYPIIVPSSTYTNTMTLEGYNLYTSNNPDGNLVRTYGIDCKLHTALHRTIVQESASLAKALNKEDKAFQLQQMQENT
jgi:hypothetical protein